LGKKTKQSRVSENDGTVIGRVRFRSLKQTEKRKRRQALAVDQHTCAQIRQANKDVTLAQYLRPVTQSHVGHPGKGLSLFVEQVTA